MEILALIGSPRKNSNCEIIVDEIAKGAEENGHTVTKYSLQMGLVLYLQAQFTLVK